MNTLPIKLDLHRLWELRRWLRLVWLWPALIVLAAGCRSTHTAERSELRRIDSLRTMTYSSVRDCTLQLPRIRVEEVFDTLPLNQPVYAFNDSLGTRLRLMRDELDRVRARVDVRPQPVTIPRVERRRTDTIVRIREQTATGRQEKRIRPGFLRRWGGWLALGLLVAGLLGSRLLRNMHPLA